MRAGSLAAAVLMLTAVCPAGCDRKGAATPKAGTNRDVPTKPAPLFVDATARAGLDFVSDCGPERTYFMPESIGSGVALLDYDNDGDLDVYFVSASYPPDATAKPISPPRNRLFRNEADHTFTDVTDQAGVGDTGYGMGAAAGDFDNDGYVDLYVTNYGANILYRNQGDGTFIDVTLTAGVGDDRWGVSAAFLDYDRDGFLDLFVVNYIELDPLEQCFDKTGRRDYCGPERFPGARDVLYYNNGDGTFTNASASSGIAAAGGLRGLGLVCADLTNDGLVDVYVANDNQPNQLWVNQGNRTFRDEGLLMGLAYNDAGQTEASMGVICGDLDNDADLDLFMTHLRGEKDTFYQNEGGGFFQDVSTTRGVVASSMAFTSFGVGAIDFDNDGDLDLAIVSGHVFRGSVEPGADLSPFWNEYAQPGRLLANDGKGNFDDISGRAGAFASVIQVGRGLALGDLDNDGDIDIVTSAACGRARLFENRTSPSGHWLIVRAYDAVLKRDAYGAVITVTAAGRKLVRGANPAFSFLSSSDPRAHFGLGDAQAIESIEILWPDGLTESFPAARADRVITLVRGQGRQTK